MNFCNSGLCHKHTQQGLTGTQAPQQNTYEASFVLNGVVMVVEVEDPLARRSGMGQR